KDQGRPRTPKRAFPTSPPQVLPVREPRLGPEREGGDALQPPRRGAARAGPVPRPRAHKTTPAKEGFGVPRVFLGLPAPFVFPPPKRSRMFYFRSYVKNKR